MKELKKVSTAHGEVTLVTLTNATGASVELTTVGAGIVAVKVQDREGKLDDVALGYADADSYFGDGPACGKIPGRYANRIDRGQFELDGVKYQIPVNNGPNSCHSGPDGFHNLNWELTETTDNSATFTHVSPDGEIGFPGKLTVTAKYVWTDDNAIELTIKATTDKATVLNLTNHAYWNLAGHNSGSVKDHVLEMPASKWLKTDQYLLPTGDVLPVDGTPMDFRTAKTIGRDFDLSFEALKFGKGYDNCWVIDSPEGTMRTAAILSEPVSGRKLEVITDQPAAQVYTGNWLTGCPANKAGRSYDDYDGVAIECQNYPDAPNHPAFPNSVLRPGEEYVRHITYKFSVF